MGSNYDFSNYFDTSSSPTPFFRPNLRLEYDPDDPNTFRPAHENIGYLKLRVRNTGRRVAHNCRADLRVLIPVRAHPAGFPSTDVRILPWGREADLTDLRETSHIRPHHWDAIHVVFAHPAFPLQPVAPFPQRFASISILDRIRNNGFAVHDTFPTGQFDVLITVTSNEINVNGTFRITIVENHLNLNMIMLPNPPNRLEIISNWFRVRQNPIRIA